MCAGDWLAGAWEKLWGDVNVSYLIPVCVIHRCSIPNLGKCSLKICAFNCNINFPYRKTCTNVSAVVNAKYGKYLR